MGMVLARCNAPQLANPIFDLASGKCVGYVPEHPSVMSPG